MIRLRVARQPYGRKLRAAAWNRAFAGLPLDLVSRVVPLLTLTAVPAGTVVVSEEEPDDGLYLVARGVVELSRAGVTLRHATAGDYLLGAGTAAGGRPVTATCLTPATLLVADAPRRAEIARIGGPAWSGRGEGDAVAPVFDFRRRSRGAGATAARS